MGQNETLHKTTVEYIRIELVSIIFGSLLMILMVVFVMLEWKSMLFLVIQMVTSSGFDYGFAIWADWADLKVLVSLIQAFVLAPSHSSF